MKTFKVNDTEFGTGMPKIAVPLISQTGPELIAAAKKAKKEPIDLIEWRLDFFDHLQDLAAVINVAHKLRQVLGTLPILVTLRTKDEGGNFQPTLTEYEEVYRQLINTGLIDMIDVEVLKPAIVTTSLIEFAHQHQVRVVLSNHDFSKTPSTDELKARLKLMNDLGTDLAKIAVMPKSTNDLLRLLSVSVDYQQQADRVPLVAIGMGKLGQLSRIAGEIFGSCITFGAIDKGSAPGQLAVTDLRKILTVLH